MGLQAASGALVVVVLNETIGLKESAWAAVAAAMIVYAMALPERYDIACGAFAFTLIVTLTIGGVHSISFLGARAWETLLGGAVGLLAAKFIFPLRV